MPTAGTRFCEITKKSSQIFLKPNPGITPTIPQQSPNERLQLPGLEDLGPLPPWPLASVKHHPRSQFHKPPEGPGPLQPNSSESAENAPLSKKHPTSLLPKAPGQATGPGSCSPLLRPHVPSPSRRETALLPAWLLSRPAVRRGRPKPQDRAGGWWSPWETPTPAFGQPSPCVPLQAGGGHILNLKLRGSLSVCPRKGASHRPASASQSHSQSGRVARVRDGGL